MARYRSSRGRSGSGRGGALLAELIIWLVPKNPVSVAGAVVIGASIYFYYPPGIGAGFVLIIGGVFLFVIIPNPMCTKDKYKDNLHRGVFDCPQTKLPLEFRIMNELNEMKKAEMSLNGDDPPSAKPSLHEAVIGKDGSGIIKHKCKNCTAELKFDSVTWVFNCEFCGGVFCRSEILGGNKK